MLVGRAVVVGSVVVVAAVHTTIHSYNVTLVLTQNILFETYCVYRILPPMPRLKISAYGDGSSICDINVNELYVFSSFHNLRFDLWFLTICLNRHVLVLNMLVYC